MSHLLHCFIVKLAISDFLNMQGAAQLPVALNKLVLRPTTSRKTINITIAKIDVLKFLAKKASDKQADDILASQITQAVEQHLAHNGQADADWSLLTAEASSTDVTTISAALVMYLEDGDLGVLEGLGDIEDGAITLQLRVLNPHSTGE